LSCSDSGYASRPEVLALSAQTQCSSPVLLAKGVSEASSLDIVQFNLALSALLFLSPNSAVLVFRRRVLNTGIKPPAAPIIELLERNKMKPRAKIALLVLLTLGGVMPLSIYFTVPAAHGLVRFSSYSELERFLLTRSSCSYGYWNGYNKQLQLYGGPASFGPAVPGALS